MYCIQNFAQKFPIHGCLNVWTPSKIAIHLLLVKDSASNFGQFTDPSWNRSILPISNCSEQEWCVYVTRTVTRLGWYFFQYLVAPNGAPSFASKVGLALRGWPSNIEVIWDQDMYIFVWDYLPGMSTMARRKKHKNIVCFLQEALGSYMCSLDGQFIRLTTWTWWILHNHNVFKPSQINT